MAIPETAISVVQWVAIILSYIAQGSKCVKFIAPDKTITCSETYCILRIVYAYLRMK